MLDNLLAFVSDFILVVMTIWFLLGIFYYVPLLYILVRKRKWTWNPITLNAMFAFALLAVFHKPYRDKIRADLAEIHKKDREAA